MVLFFKRSKYRFISLGLLLLLVLPELSAQTDTLYIKWYYNNLVPRLLTNYKQLSTSFSTRSDTMNSVDYFSTGGQNFMGVEVSYKWATLGYNFGFNKENSSSNTDLRLSTSFKPWRLQVNYISLKNLSYYRVNGKEQLDTVFVTRQHTIGLQTLAVKADYILNYKNFYYSSSISQVGQQLKSKGSFIISAGFSQQVFDFRGLSDTIGKRFLDRYSIDDFKSLRIDIGLGYAYNWVPTKHWTLSISDIVNMGFQQINTSGENSAGQQHYTVSFTNYVRAGVVYNWSRYFIGGYAYNAITTSNWSVYTYQNVYTSLQLHFGIVLPDPQEYWRMRKNKG